MDLQSNPWTQLSAQVLSRWEHKLSAYSPCDNKSFMQNHDLSIAETSASEPKSPEAPPYSPIQRSTPLSPSTVQASPDTSQIEDPSNHLEEQESTVQVSQDANHGSDHPPESESPRCGTTWCGFKVVGDNIDKNVHPRHESLDQHTRSLHYFNCYAVKDRIDLGSLSDLKPLVDISQVDLTQLLPQKEDIEGIIENMAILAA